MQEFQFQKYLIMDTSKLQTGILFGKNLMAKRRMKEEWFFYLGKLSWIFETEIVGFFFIFVNMYFHAYAYYVLVTLN